MDFKTDVAARSRATPRSPRPCAILATGSRVAAHGLTTKDTKSTQETEYETIDAIFEFRRVEVHRQSALHSRQLRRRRPWGVVNAPGFLALFGARLFSATISWFSASISIRRP